jgi:hypothetical protein
LELMRGLLASKGSPFKTGAALGEHRTSLVPDHS